MLIVLVLLDFMKQDLFVLLVLIHVPPVPEVHPPVNLVLQQLIELQPPTVLVSQYTLITLLVVKLVIIEYVPLVVL